MLKKFVKSIRVSHWTCRLYWGANQSRFFIYWQATLQASHCPLGFHSLQFPSKASPVSAQLLTSFGFPPQRWKQFRVWWLGGKYLGTDGVPMQDKRKASGSHTPGCGTARWIRGGRPLLVFMLFSTNGEEQQPNRNSHGCSAKKSHWERKRFKKAFCVLVYAETIFLLMSVINMLLLYVKGAKRTNQVISVLRYSTNRSLNHPVMLYLSRVAGRTSCSI